MSNGAGSTRRGLVRNLADLRIKPAAERIAVDGRRPLRLDEQDRIFQVVSGYVDVFASAVEAGRAGRRHHLFRVDTGGLVLDLPRHDSDQGPSVVVTAVGGPGAEVVALTRDGIDDFAVVESWIAALSAAISGPAISWDARDSEAGSLVDLETGARQRAPVRGLAWIRVEQGQVRLMEHHSVFGPGHPPLPLAAGTWIEAVTPARVRTSPATVGADAWPGIERFHAVALSCIARRITAADAAQATRIAERATLAAAHAHEAFDRLANVVDARREGAAQAEGAADPLWSVCRIIGDVIGVPMVRPGGRRGLHSDVAEVMDIARASRLRTRRTLLRDDWWRHNAGPLVAWHATTRRPVALTPTSSRRYVMIDAATGARHVVTRTLARELAPEAVTFYPPLPSGALSLWDLLGFGLRPVQADLLRIVIAAAVIGVLGLAGPLAIEIIIGSAIPRTRIDQLAYSAMALAVVAIVTAGFYVMQGVAMLRLEGLVDWTLQAATLDRLLRLPASFFRRFTAGDLVDRALGINAIRTIVTGRALRGLLAGMVCFFSFLLMFYYDARLAWIALGLTALRGAIVMTTAAWRLRRERRHFELQGKVQGLVLQLLTAVAKLKVAAATSRALGVWARQFAAQKRHFVASQRAANLLKVVDAAFPLAATLILFAAAHGGPAGALTQHMGEFLAFYAAFGLSLAAAGEWGIAVAETLIAVPRLARLRPLIAEATEIADDRKSPGELFGAIELSQVTFRYVPTGPPVLNNVSLRVEAGEYVALVGPSGSGKSTVFRLLLGFEKPEVGGIFFDGKPLDTLDVSTVRRQIGVVLQNGKLTSGSLYENICGGVQLPFEQAWEAARLAGLAADIEAMPMGMHTFIAEGVSTLSGGQRQRLMIARALVHRPRILLFDEATSALDNQTQSIVSTSLAKLNVTRLMIAHRLSTVKDVDRIVVLNAGSVVQCGRFEELSAVPGTFAELARRQLL